MCVVCTLLIIVIDRVQSAAKPVLIKGGKFVMGNSLDTQLTHASLQPQSDVEVNDFYMDDKAATNEEFKQFIQETKYVTDSEKYKWSFVLELQATDMAKEITNQTVKDATHWLAVPGASWKFPDGPYPEASKEDKEKNKEKMSFRVKPDHPVTHISYNDAKKYCEWKKMRLPTETEWEYAARGGLKQKKYPWGDSAPFEAGDGHLKKWKMNIWQGEFPTKNTKEDGYISTAPVDKYEPNPYGLYNMVGNVWEWCETEFVGPEKGQRVLRGASYLDTLDGSKNHPATINARMGNTDDSASSNTGVRCAKDAPNAPKKKKPGYKYPKVKPRMDQDFLSKLAEKGGIEALQEHLGDAAQIMTPAQLKAKKEALEKQKAELLKKMEKETGEKASEDL